MENSEGQEINSWRNEHGEPDFDYLLCLKEDGSTEAMEKLISVATDLDVDFNATTTKEELLGRIRMATQKNEDGNSNQSN